MKKLFIISIFSILFSCNNRDEDNPINQITDTSTLLTQITGTNEKGDNFYNLTLNYNGDKITELLEQNNDITTKITFQYTGNLITSTTEESNISKNYKKVTNYTYNNGKLTQTISKEQEEDIGLGLQQYDYIRNYEYKQDSIIVTELTADINGNFIQNTKPFTANIKNGEYSNIIWGSYASGYENYYEYGTANNPLKNIKGLDEILLNFLVSMNYTNLWHIVPSNVTKQIFIFDFSGKRISNKDIEVNYQNFPIKVNMIEQISGHSTTGTDKYTFTLKYNK